jgi:hypothetical protein
MPERLPTRRLGPEGTMTLYKALLLVRITHFYFGCIFLHWHSPGRQMSASVSQKFRRAGESLRWSSVGAGRGNNLRHHMSSAAWGLRLPLSKKMIKWTAHAASLIVTHRDICCFWEVGLFIYRRFTTAEAMWCQHGVRLLMMKWEVYKKTFTTILRPYAEFAW